jgi:hypothetical protein
MHADDAVVDLATTPQILPCGADGMPTTLDGSRFVDTADRLSMRVFACDHVLTFIAHPRFIPLDRFHETL